MTACNCYYCGRPLSQLETEHPHDGNPACGDCWQFFEHFDPRKPVQASLQADYERSGALLSSGEQL